MKLGVNERLKGKKLYREVWKPVITDKEDYTGLYEISNMGRIRNVKTGNIFKGSKDKGGYLLVSLTKNGKGKTHSVHRLVAFAFVKGYFEGAHIDHIDTCKTKNIWTNLRWVTAKENNNNELTREHHNEAHNKKVICIETGQIFNSMNEAGEYVGVSGNAISKCVRGEQRSCRGFHWKYYGCSEEETKKKLREINGKKVICIETGKIFNSLKEAGEHIGVHKSAISACVRGKQKTSGGFHWKYYYEEEVDNGVS